MGSGIDLQDFVAGFILEADEHLHSANRNLVAVSEALKNSKLDPRAVRELFRSLHTIKGLASMVGAVAIVDLSHEMEGILRAADRTGGRLSETALDLLVKGTQVISDRVKLIPKLGVSGIPKAPARLLEELIHFQTADQPQLKPRAKQALELPEEVLRSLSPGDQEQISQGLSSKNRTLYLIDFEPSPGKVAVGLNITSVRERIGKIAELIKVTPHSSKKAPTGIAFFLLIFTEKEMAEIISSTGIDETSISAVSSSEEQTVESELEKTFSEDVDLDAEIPNSETESTSIRVDIHKLDEVLERLSELIVTRSKLIKITERLAAKGADTRELQALVSENGRQLKRLRSAITQARMVSLSELLQRLPLVVRGLVKDSDKAVDLYVQAGKAEVDKAVADKIFPAIVHIIRNSVDHAVETKAERNRLGKDESGVISVNCDDSSGTSLLITIKDDGRGIDKEAVAKKSGQPIATNDEELLRQICTPGLSTREDVTQTSGRGMGMDIVKRTVEMLGGSIRLSTAQGTGTVFTIKVPVSITIVDVLSFVSGQQVYVAPVSMIDEIIEVDLNVLPKAPHITKSGPMPRLLNRRGETIPFFILDSVLKNQADQTNPTRALIVNQLNGAVAFGVDRMLGQQEVVIRPIDEKIVRTKGLNGAADLGEGHPTLVLDLASLGAEYASKSEVNV